MFRDLIEVMLHPLTGPARAGVRWSVVHARWRSMLALVVLGLMAGSAVFVFLWTSNLAGWSVARAGAAVVPLSLLAGIGFSASRLLIGGTLVRLLWRLRWNRAARELAHIRIMSASMWALIPEALVMLLIGVWCAVSLHRPWLVLVLPFFGNILFFALILFHAFTRLRGAEHTCDRCGYLLLGLPDPRCPECGEPFPVEWTEPRSAKCEQAVELS